MKKTFIAALIATTLISSINANAYATVQDFGTKVMQNSIGKVGKHVIPACKQMSTQSQENIIGAITIVGASYAGYKLYKFYRSLKPKRRQYIREQILLECSMDEKGFLALITLSVID